MNYIDEIQDLKARWGEQLLILAHHYQRNEITDVAHRLGDSYELSSYAAKNDRAKFVVFCGVRFMAEAAETLRRPNQIVVHPAPHAGCPMADMAPVDKAREAWKTILEVRGEKQVTPLVYMNSSTELKAMVGRHGGSVCTSSNAHKAFQWGFSQRNVIFFFPDEHLGRNTANKLSIPPHRLVVWDPALPQGGLTEQDLKNAKVVLWKGFCHVHTAFEIGDIEKARAMYPRAKILVHPECTQEVVNLADDSGSTSQLIRMVEQAGPGSTCVIGTEINLIGRLAREYADRTIVPLKRSLCGNMFRIGPKNLFESLQSLPNPEPVKVDEKAKQEAKTALERMLSI